MEGERRPPPAELELAVTAAAAELHRNVASDNLFLLALTRLGPDRPARQALEAEGVTSDRLLEHVVVDGDRSAALGPGLHYAPAYYSMYGRADAFAAALGDGTITPEHVLLALVWDANSHTSQAMWFLGVSRRRVIDRLGELGVSTPAAALPDQRGIEVDETIWFDRDQVATVIDHLRLHIPPDVQWGFNYEGDRAYVSAESSVDLEALVAEALPPAIEVRRIDHVQLAMPAGREDDAVAFYQGLLGIPHVNRPEPLAARGGCWFEQDDVRIHLGVDDGFRPARKAHPALLVRGLSGLAERLRAQPSPWSTASHATARHRCTSTTRSAIEWSCWSGAVHCSDRCSEIS